MGDLGLTLKNIVFVIFPPKNTWQDIVQLAAYLLWSQVTETIQYFSIASLLF